MNSKNIYKSLFIKKVVFYVSLLPSLILSLQSFGAQSQAVEETQKTFTISWTTKLPQVNGDTASREFTGSFTYLGTFQDNESLQHEFEDAVSKEPIQFLNYNSIDTLTKTYEEEPIPIIVVPATDDDIAIGKNFIRREQKESGMKQALLLTVPVEKKELSPQKKKIFVRPHTLSWTTGIVSGTMKSMIGTPLFLLAILNKGNSIDDRAIVTALYRIFIAYLYGIGQESWLNIAKIGQKIGMKIIPGKFRENHSVLSAFFDENIMGLFNTYLTTVIAKKLLLENDFWSSEILLEPWAIAFNRVAFGGATSLAIQKAEKKGVIAIHEAAALANYVDILTTIMSIFGTIGDTKVATMFTAVISVVSGIQFLHVEGKLPLWVLTFLRRTAEGVLYVEGKYSYWMGPAYMAPQFIPQALEAVRDIPDKGSYTSFKTLYDKTVSFKWINWPNQIILRFMSRRIITAKINNFKCRLFEPNKKE